MEIVNMIGNKLDYQCTSVTPEDLHAPKLHQQHTSTLSQILQLALTPEQATMQGAVACW